MALGKRKREQQQAWVATTDLPKAPGRAFYTKLNELLAAAEFDRWIEQRCGKYYAEGAGRPGIPPGVYIRMVLVGYFEGVSSQRGVAWRCADSRSLAEFLGYGPTERTPDHSSMTRVHQRIPKEVHDEVFAFILRIANDEGLLSGKTVGVDATTLEANAAMKSIIRKDSGEDWDDHVRRLAEEAGVEIKDEADLRNFDKNRKNKTASNEDWESKTDADARIAKMKDGRTHLAYKAEHVVDLTTNIIIAAPIYHADHADPHTLEDSVMLANRRRNETPRGKKLQKLRSEYTERTFAHVCETGGSRRCWLHGIEKVSKRYLLQVAAHNLGVILRATFGVGTPRSLQDLRALLHLPCFNMWNRANRPHAQPIGFYAHKTSPTHLAVAL